jgi:TRAP-type C4-dicarboxylate transport system permease small subunit
MSGWLEPYRKIIDTTSNVCNVISQVFVGIMIFLVAADAAGRYLLNHPIPGALEITELMMVFIVFLAFAYVESKDGHVRVDLVISRLPRKVRPYIYCLDTVITLGIVAIMAWQSVLYSLELRQSGNVSAYWGMRISPFLWVVAFGCLLFCLQLILKILRLVNQARSPK